MDACLQIPFWGFLFALAGDPDIATTEALLTAPRCHAASLHFS